MSAPIPLIVLTNGRRDCISRTIPSIHEHLTGLGDMVIVDDSGDSGYRAWLAAEFSDALVTAVAEKPAGYWRAMRTVWAIARGSGADHWMLAEDDFLYERDVDLRVLASTLDKQGLTQIVLRRQSWFANERRHGGVIEAREAEGAVFSERSDGMHYWIEHRDHWSMNPTILKVELTQCYEWPTGSWSESRFGRSLLRDPNVRFAYWGRRTDLNWVTHIGVERAGSDY